MDNVMNDIEFRAKDAIQKVWCYGFYSIGINPSSEWLEATIQTVNPDGTYGEKISIDRNTVGVWIGKKDKAGRKIFTDDILRMRLPIGYAVGYVMYDINGCTFVLHLHDLLGHAILPTRWWDALARLGGRPIIH